MTKITLPRRCFISHAYADLEYKALIEALPPDVDARTFPEIAVAPDQLVSNELVAAILECDGLIYLDGGHSARSFWVAFERDYALRAGKQVFSATIDTYTLAVHDGDPLDLATFASYHKEDRDRVREISEFLRRERYFDLLWDTEDGLPGDDLVREIESGIRDRLLRGGYVVVFWSRAARESGFVENELGTAMEGMEGVNDRVLFALLDDTPLPEFWTRFQEPGVQVYTDEERIDRHRWDDLVVRLYWLIYRKTQYRNVGIRNA